MHWKNNFLKHQQALFIQQLANLYEEKEALSIFFWCVEYYLGLSKIDLTLQQNRKLSESEILKFHFALKSLKTGKPVQYVLGFAHFYGKDFEVNPSVLIPRPETEELVHWILSDHANAEKLKVLDIGTGSGCIPITLKAERSYWEMLGIDISEQALMVARKNAIRHKVAINFQSVDALNMDFANLAFVPNLIVSNPPYVSRGEIDQMRKNVLEFEPHEALFPKNHDDLIFYKKIIEIFLQNSEVQFLYFEINQYNKNQLEDYLNLIGHKDFEFKKDLSNHWRMLKLVK